MRLSFTTGRVPLSAGDWLIVTCIGLLLVIGGYWLATAISTQFTSEIPARGGSFTEGIVGTPRFVNPVLAISDADRDITELIYAGLMREIHGTLVPDVAEGYVLSEDRKTYTFTIREGATFHDGVPVTAEDVAFTIDLIADPAVKSPKRANWEGVLVEVVDPRTISFTLKEPYAPFVENTRIGILPKHLWKEVRIEELPFSKLNIEPVGAGPYRVAHLAMTSAGIPSALDLVAFTGAAHVPYITRLSFQFFGDTDSLETALSKNSALAAHSVSPENASGQVVHEAVLGRVFGVFFNQNQNNIFASKTVRVALDAALDKELIVSTLIGGYGSPAAGPLPRESVAEDIVDTTSTDDAATILEKDGWKKGEDGFWTKTVKKSTTRLSFSLVTSNAPELKKAAELVESQWRAFGVDVTVKYFDQSDLQQDVIRPRKYDALLFGEVVGRDADLFAFWDSSQRNDPGLNIALYTNTSVDTLLREARSTEDPEERHARIKKAADIISSEAAAVFLYSPHFVYLTHPSVNGIELGTIITPADRFSSVTEWYLETERVWPLFK